MKKLLLLLCLLFFACPTGEAVPAMPYASLRNTEANIAFNANTEWNRLDLTARSQSGNGPAYNLTLHNTVTRAQTDNVYIQISDVSKNTASLNENEIESALVGSVNIMQENFATLGFENFGRDTYQTAGKKFIMLSALRPSDASQLLWAATITNGYLIHVQAYVNSGFSSTEYTKRASNFRIILDTVRPLNAR